jgi:glycosyltransferase involved in cell wall biosynthesis
MACGAVPIAARSGALPEIVEDGVSGLLVPERDAVALTGAIQKLIQNEGQRRLFAANGIDRVHRLFTAEGSTAEIVRVYESMWAESQTDGKVKLTRSCG